MVKFDKTILEKISEIFEVVEQAASNSTYIVSDIENMSEDDFTTKIYARANRIEKEIKEIKALLEAKKKWNRV